jgi:hypothetical protein
MSKIEPPEAGQQVPPEESKPKTCPDCGFLTIEGRELSKEDRAFVSWAGHTQNYDWESSLMPRDARRMSCSKGLWEYDHRLGSKDDLIDEIERSRDDCTGFAPYERGLTPAILRKQIEDRNNSQRLEKILKEIALSREYAPAKSGHLEPTPGALPNIFEMDGQMVHIRFGGKEVGRFANYVGMKYLAFIVTHPAQVFQTAIELRRAVYPGDPNETRTSHDKTESSSGFQEASYSIEDTREDIERGLSAYEEGLRYINARRDEMDRVGDLDPIERQELDAQEEAMNSQIDRLKQGKRRKAELAPQLSNLEKSIRQAVFRALDLIEAATNGTELATHFKQTLRPFQFPLRYDPGPNIRWNE